MTGGQLHDQWIGESRESVVHRIADMAMVDIAAIRSGNELDDLARVQRPIDGFEGAGVRRALLRDRMSDLAERRPNGVDPGQIACHQRVLARHLGAHAVGALDVDDAAIDEPGERVVEGRKLVHRETIFGVFGVQEVEGVLQVDVMGVTAVDGVRNGVRVHRITTLYLLTGYAQEGKVH